MQITVTLQTNDKSIDFQLNADMIISDALIIISENSNLEFDENNKYIYSNRNEKWIPITYTFIGAKIFSGDILKVKEKYDG